MNQTLFNLAFSLYSKKEPYNDIRDKLIEKGASNAEADEILNEVFFRFNLNNAPSATQTQAVEGESGGGFWGTIGGIISIIGLIINVVQCMN